VSPWLHIFLHPHHRVLLAFLPSFTIIILPDPPETAISGVFLGIRLSSRPVLRWVKPPSPYNSYLHLENRGLKRLINGLILG